MSNFYAEFALSGSPCVMIRKDTRIYFHPKTGRLRTTGCCKGVVWMCNPGSAKSPNGPNAAYSWGPIEPDGTLRRVLALYCDAALLSKKSVGQDDYLAILNCFYSCGAGVTKAYNAWISSGCSYVEPIPNTAGFIMAAWGDKPIKYVTPSIARIQASRLPVFFHDPRTGKAVSTSFPTLGFPTHPSPQNRHFTQNRMALAGTMAALL